jgi:hypothetical protein
MRYRLRTLLILLAVLPPVLWGGFVAWGRYVEWRAERLNRNAPALASPRVRIVPMPPAPKNTFPPEVDYQYPPESLQRIMRDIEPPAMSPRQSPPP